MTFEEFLSGSLAPSAFWQAASAIATLLAVLVAVFTPMVQAARRTRRFERMILGEVFRNRQALEARRQIHVAPTKDIPMSGEQSLLDANSLARRMQLDISSSLWEGLRTEISAERASCFAEAYRIFEMVRSPQDHVSTNYGMGLEYLLIKNAAGMAVYKYDQLAKRCRYLRDW